jgi:membrane-associated phospholipid phosphatase/tRNA A-37 threonylcarbamoyl transferase component Bud32
VDITTPTGSTQPELHPERLRDVEGTGRVLEGIFTRRRRRPSGEPPPLPRDLHRTGRWWIGGLVVVLAAWTLILGGASGELYVDRFDVAILERLEAARSSGVTRVMNALHALGSDWTLRAIGWAVVVGGLAFKRFRHVLVFLLAVLLVSWLSSSAAVLFSRPRPYNVEIIGDWQGYSHPSRVVADLSVSLLGIAYVMIEQGRWRQRFKWVAGAALVALGAARLYLGVDHPTDVAFGAVIGVAATLVAFRTLTPNEVFPVTYRRGRTAHLDISGPRDLAIRTALEDQLGLVVADVAPFGLEGSGGSTPLRIQVKGEPPTYLFGKLYAANHLRADRWYKLGRTLLYGRLEDEARFTTVRQLIQYEDYLLRVMEDAGLPTPEPYGFVEITPGREYLLVTEFATGAVELGHADVDDGLIDQGLDIVRRLWEAGVAHRDIKPANLLVRNGELLLIDVAFGEVRPSPWRQAVDLANMMLVLGLRSTPERVYERALRVFTPDELAEAFAATRSVTMPTQLRHALREDGRDLLSAFRRLAPPRKPIAIQRWSVRRIGLLVSLAVGALAVLTVLLSGLQNANLL